MKQRTQATTLLQRRGLYATWGLFFVSVGLYAFFMLSGNWSPHPAWWLVTSIAVLSAAFFSVGVGCLAFWNRPNRSTQIAYLMWTLTPLACFASFLWSTIDAANNRENIRLHLPSRTLGVWIGNFFEWEAGYRTPRKTIGKHVVLHDNGLTPNVDRLVLEMDQHVEAMAKVLGTQPATTKSSWVRGMLGGQGGRAVGKWAICKVDSNVGELTGLDRHEVAHTMITLLAGPATQTPPMLFAEGWAEANSRDSNEMLKGLLTLKLEGSQRNLASLVAEDLYGRSVGPMYNYGGPVVLYLIERFGGEKFLELYQGVRPGSFNKDFDQIAGIPFERFEADFWNWLEGQEQRLASTNRAKAKGRFSYAQPELAPEWENILRAADAYHLAHPFPKTFGLEVKMEADRDNELLTLTSKVVVENDQCWEMHHSPEKSESTSISGREYQSVSVRTESGKTKYEREVAVMGKHSQLVFLQQTLHQQNRLDKFLGVDPTQMIFLRVPQWKIHIEDIQAAQQYTDVKLKVYLEPPNVNASYELLLDPKNGYRVVRGTTYRAGQSKSDAYTTHYTYGNLAGGSFVCNYRIENEKFKRESWYKELSENEVKEVKEKVNSTLVQHRPKNVGQEDSDSDTTRPWFRKLPVLTILIWALLMPALFLVDIAGNRFRLNNCPSEQETP